MAPGIRQSAIGAGGARLLWIAPGTSMPLHGHSGGELTLDFDEPWSLANSRSKRCT